MRKPLEFIKNQKLMVIASSDEKDIWVAPMVDVAEKVVAYQNKAK